MSQLSCFLRSQHRSLTIPIRCAQGQQQACKQLCLSLEEARLSAAHGRQSTSVIPQTTTREKLVESPLLSVSLEPPSLLRLAPYPHPEPDTALCSLLDLLSVNDVAVRLPCVAPSAPIVSPPTEVIRPQELPQRSTAVTSLVEPEGDLMPRLLPHHRYQRNISMECINMIRLRRKKMKKHKRKKEYKRNRISIEHNKLLKTIQLEKAFMNEQMVLLREAQSFSAEQYVQQRLDLKNNRPVPKFWQGKRLPEVCVLELMVKDGLPIPGSEEDCDYSYDNK